MAPQLWQPALIEAPAASARLHSAEVTMQMESSFDSACSHILQQRNFCWGCAIVDLQTGLPLGSAVHDGGLCTPQDLELAALRAAGVATGETTWRMAQEFGAAGDSFIRTIHVTTEQAHHFFAPADLSIGTGLVVLIMDRACTLGMGWSTMRQVVAELQQAPLAPDHPSMQSESQWGQPAPHAEGPFHLSSLQ